MEGTTLLPRAGVAGSTTEVGRAVQAPVGVRPGGAGRAPLPHLGPGRYLVREEEHGSTVFPLTQATIRIGRGMSADLTIDDVTVSRRHALIVHRGQRTMILDDRSLNGVIVNGRRVSEAPLRDADVITLGRAVFVFMDVY